MTRRSEDGIVWTLAEKYYDVSAYVYCMNNPIKLIDPTGMDWEPTNPDDPYHSKMVFIAAVRNSSSNKQLDMNGVLKTIIDQYSNDFGEGFEIKIRVLGKDDELKTMKV
jgi:hypothetical protein